MGALSIGANRLTVTGASGGTLQFSGSASSVQFNTDAGRTYQVQFATALSVTPPTSWTTLTNVLGTGGLATVNDTTATNAIRFYRIKL